MRVSRPQPSCSRCSCRRVAVPATGPPADGVIVRPNRAALYAANCSSCHGPRGQGISTPGRPGVADLAGTRALAAHAGALAADFYLRTGLHAAREPARAAGAVARPLHRRQLDALIAYVASLGHGPAIPKPTRRRGSLSAGFALFTDHCAGCHQVAAEGGYVTGARVPPLEQATDVEIAEAVRTGPYVMPKFSPRAIYDPPARLDRPLRRLHEAPRGSRRSGRSDAIGPVPEGIVAWLIAGRGADRRLSVGRQPKGPL